MTDENQQKTSGADSSTPAPEEIPPEEIPPEEIPTVQKIVSIAWPSFLIAGLATILFFAWIDPVELLAGSRFHGASRLGAYTIGFFLLWIVTFTSSALTCYFRRSCKDCNPKNP